jgi:hypothetical protein
VVAFASIGLALATIVARGGAEVRFEVRDVSGEGARQWPVTLSAVLPVGLFHDDDVCVVARDAPGGPAVVPAQLDVLSRHDDGSILHALVTVRVDLAPHATSELFLVPSPSPPLAGPLDGGERSKAPPVLVELVRDDGAHFTALIDPPAVDARPATTGPVFGPLAQEVERVARLAGPEGELDHVEVRARWRRLAGVAATRVEVVVENGVAPLPAGARPDDVEFQRLAIFAGDTPLCDLPSGIVHDRTRFAVRRFVGAAPRIEAREDLATLVRLGCLPPLDVRQPIGDGVAGDLAKRIVDSKENGDVRPSEWPIGVPLDPGPITRYMPATGDRGDIGPIPTWATIALQSCSVYAEDVLLAADQNGAASFPVHVRDERGAMGIEFAAAAPMEKRATGRKCPCVPDRQHLPLLGYVTFLLTGERFAEEELAAYASYCFYDWPHDGEYRHPGTRDFAWSLRTTMLAAKFLPDANPRKKYLRERMEANLKLLRERVTKSDSPLHTWGAGSFECSGRKSWPCATQWSPWQAAWVDASLWWTARVHGNGDARALFEWQSQYFTRAYSSVGQSWSAPDGTLVTWQNGHHALAYSFPAASYTPTFAKGEWREQRDSVCPIDSFAEALWWLRVNLDHEFAPDKPPALPAGPDGTATLAAASWRPNAGYSPPPPPANSWVAYAMHWLAVVLEAEGTKEGHAVYVAVKPCVDSTVAVPGMRFSPELIRKP